MSQQVIEGTWEEIKLHEPDLIGRHLKLIVGPEQIVEPKPLVTTKPKVLRGRGAFKGYFGGTAAILAEKQAEIEREGS